MKTHYTFYDPAYLVILFYPHMQMLCFTAVHPALVNYVDEPAPDKQTQASPQEAPLQIRPCLKVSLSILLPACALD